MKKTNIKNRWIVLCEQSSVDINTNHLSLFRTIEEININSPKQPLPVLPPEGVSAVFPHELVAVWSRYPEITENDLDVVAKLRLCDPNGGVLHEQDIKMTFQKGKQNLRTLIKFDQFKFKTAGEYRYELELVSDNVNKIKADVSFVVVLK
jgi:hypothetical protein